MEFKVSIDPMELQLVEVPKDFHDLSIQVLEGGAVYLVGQASRETIEDTTYKSVFISKEEEESTLSAPVDKLVGIFTHPGVNGRLKVRISA